MSALSDFERRVGGRWTGIVFHKEEPPEGNLADRKMRFCEAIRESSRRPVTLTKDRLNCPGALRSFGWSENGEARLVQSMAKKSNIPEETARKLIGQVPALDRDIRAITIGSYESPDVVLSYAQPEAIMRFVSKWQEEKGDALDLKVSSVMAVCGWVAAGAFINGNICLSFGCPESRSFGAIGNDRMIIGLPAEMLDEIKI